MVELISKEGNKVEFKVLVFVVEVNCVYDQVWVGFVCDVCVFGFCFGKVLCKVIENCVGKGYVELQVCDCLFEIYYLQGLCELGFNFVDVIVDFQDVQSGQVFEFIVKGEIYFEVKFGDWQGFKVSVQVFEIIDEVFEQIFSDLCECNVLFEKVECFIEVVDQVIIQEFGEGDSEEGGSYFIYFDMVEEYVCNVLFGKSVGDVVDIIVFVYQYGDYEYVEYIVCVKVVEVSSKKFQDLNDEFVISLNYELMDKLCIDLCEEFECCVQQEGDNLCCEEFVGYFVEGMIVEIFQVLIDCCCEGMMSEIQDDLCCQGVQWKEYEVFMQEQGKFDEFEVDFIKNVEICVCCDFVFEQFVIDLNVQVNEVEFNQILMNFVQVNGMNVQQFVQQFGQDGVQLYYISLLCECGFQWVFVQFSGEGQSIEVVSFKVIGIEVVGIEQSEFVQIEIVQNDVGQIEMVQSEGEQQFE